MSKIFLFMMVTLDGYFEGSDHNISWHNTDEEFSKFADEQLDEVDTLIFGHRTYEMMADFWPTKHAMDIEPGTATRMNSFRKVVFAHQTLNTDWNNTESSTDVVGKIKDLQKDKGKDIAVLGSSNLGKFLIEQNLLDEIRIMINPLFIGSGTTLFDGLIKNQQLKLKSSRTFGNGNMLLIYSMK
jgi:dihydrofolate reductase